ncbi:MAG: NYN domain-containing protein [Planctomycetaceae bacterium]
MTDKIKPKLVRTAVYIDGFNLYYGLKEKNWRKYYWLDLWAFAESLANGRQLVSVKYFTADVGGGGGKVLRQQTFLNAITAHVPQVEIINAFSKCQMPQTVIKPDGTELHRPSTWS